MENKCKFGIELPNFVADIFLNKPERFFSQRLMPEGTIIPVQAHSADKMADRINEIGFDYAVYTMRPHDPDAAVNAAKWAKKHGLALALNNPACQIHGEPTPGFNTWVYPPELMERVKAEAELICVVYDELIHHQVHPGLTGHTNPWNALADVSDCQDIIEAYNRIQGGLKKLFAHTAQTGIPAFTEQVVPALFHAVARNGGNPGCKVMKEQNSPVSISLCMSAAHQYGSKWYATVDLWEGDSGPWYQVMSRNSGHSPKELLSALKLIALLNPHA